MVKLTYNNGYLSDDKEENNALDCGGVFMTSEERLKAGKYQLTMYSANQYLLWRVAMVKSIKRILENADDFYNDFKHELRQADDDTGDQTVHLEIKNGLVFEALAQSMQAIEDLFSLMKNAADISYFVKHVIVYQAGAVNQYIRDFDTENIEYLLKQMQLLYFPLDEPWENAEIFEHYKNSVLLTQDYLRELKMHHNKFSLHYNQYKHGQAVALRPFATPPEGIEDNMLEAGLMAFDSLRFEKRTKKAVPPPAFVIPHFHPDIAGHVSELHNEDNLLRADLQVIHIDTLIGIAEKAYTLINVFWNNLVKQSNATEEDEFLEQCFPIKDYQRVAEIGFPKSEL
jgi:hypothetical protein